MARPFHFRRTMPVKWSRAAIACSAALLPFVAGCRGDSRAGGHRDSVAVVAGSDRADCDVSRGDVQIAGGIGVLRPGTRVSELRERCDVVRDTTVRGVEGMPARMIVVALGADSAVAEIQDDSVWRVRLTSRRYRSENGIGIGTPARRLAELSGAGAYAGEGEVYVLIPSECGISYRISGAELGRVASASSAEEALRSMPPSAEVDLILIWGCAPDVAPSGFRSSDPMLHRRVSAGVMS